MTTLDQTFHKLNVKAELLRNIEPAKANILYFLEDKRKAERAKARVFLRIKARLSN